MKIRILRTIAFTMGVILLTTVLAACSAKGTAGGTSGESASIPGTEKSADRDDDVEKDEAYISLDEKWGRIAEGMLGSAGSPVKEYSGYLGYGYNMITAAYYNHRDINEGHPIIDMDKMAKDIDKDHVYVLNQEAKFSTPKTYVHSSTKSYAEEISAKAGVRGDYPLAGSFAVNFEMKSDFQMTSNQRLVTLQSNLETRRDYIMAASPTLLAGFLTEEFRSDLIALQADADNKNVADFIKKYGTHVLTNVTMGGRFDLNYFYTNKTSKEIVDLKVAIEASYKRISTGSESEHKTAREELESSSSLFVTAYGGSVTINPKSIDEAIDSYPVWSTSVEQGNASFVDASEVYPIWDLISAVHTAAPEADKELFAGKADLVQAYCTSEKNSINSAFKETKGVTIPPVYISEIFIGVGSSDAEAKNKLRGKGVKENNIVNVDLNKDAGGQWIYLGYKTTTDENQAIRLIAADYFTKEKTSNSTYKGFDMTILKEDLNTGAGGKYIYLYYTKNKAAGQPLTEIIYQVDNSFEKDLENVDAYQSVQCIYNDEPMDFNKGAKGAFVYLWYK